MNEEQFRRLLDAYLSNRIYGKDLEDFLDYIKTHPSEANKALISSGMTAAQQTAGDTADVPGDRMLQRLLQQIQNEQPVVTMNTGRRKWWPAAAVVAALAFGAGYMGWLNNSREGQNNAALVTPSPESSDVRPGTTKAVLTLADGKKIVLDSATSGLLATQANATIINRNGQLTYEDGDAKNASPVFNVLTTHFGEQYPLTLSDGTKLWLNAGSSVRFPVAFVGRERKVEITGEVYFEVAKDASKPFVVKRLNEPAEILVMGTHFNVNAYNDEAAMKVTLLEGAVKVFNGDESGLMTPGEQAVFGRAGGLEISRSSDPAEAIAWKNGFFKFNSADIGTVMRQISRWYNVKVRYEGVMPDDRFSGVISRKNDISQALKILELGELHFRIDDRTVTVLQ